MSSEATRSSTSSTTIEISYAAPLAKPFMGAKTGEERAVAVGDRTTLFRVVGIEWPGTIGSRCRCHPAVSSLLSFSGKAMAAQIQLSSDASALEPALDAARNDRTHQVLPDVAYRRLGIVDVVFCGPPQAGDRAWVLIDAGLTRA